MFLLVRKEIIEELISEKEKEKKKEETLNRAITYYIIYCIFHSTCRIVNVAMYIIYQQRLCFIYIKFISQSFVIVSFKNIEIVTCFFRN